MAPSSPTPRELTFDSIVTVAGSFTGGGTQGSGTTFEISAPAAIGDFYFHGWSGADADAFADPNGQITNFTMPDDEVTLKAVYLATGTTSTAISSQAPFAVSSSQVFSPGDAINAFNGVGLGGDDLHDVGFNLGWMANGAVAEGKWITIDLGGEYELTSLDVWNGNLPGATGKGIQQADIYYSANANFDFDLNAHGTDTSFNVGGWNALILDQQFHESVPDAATGKAPQTDHILLDGTKARYLAISVDSNFLPENTSLGSPEDIALSEIKINGVFVPTPRELTFDSNVTVAGSFTGGGTQGSGTTFEISAPAAIGDFYFHGWSGADADAFADPNGQITNFTMPDDEVTLKAVYLATGTTSTAISSQAPFAVSSSQVFSPGDAINAFNGVGLGGDDLHDVGFNLGWMANGAVAEGKWITIDLGGEYELTSLDVWNGNLPGATGKGIQQADIYYSANANFDFDLNAHGTDTSFNVGGWNALILDQQFHESVPDAATGKAPQTDHILLDGTKARYLAISVDSNFLPENTSLGSPEDIALSEIKINGVFVPTPRELLFDSNVTVAGSFTGGGTQGSGTTFEISAPAAIGDFYFHGWSGADADAFADPNGQITNFTMPDDEVTLKAVYLATGTTSTAISSQAPFAVSSSQVFSPGDAINAFNGVGLGGDDLHDVGFNLGWMANGAVAEGKWITIDLGGEYELTSLDVWNGNLPGATGKGIQQADIYYSANANFDFDLNAHGTDTSFNVGGWNALILDQQFHESVPDAATGKAPQTDHILLDGTKARYLAISVDSNFLPENTSLGSPEDIALSEIKINGVFVPTPRELLFDSNVTVAGSFTGGGTQGSGTTFEISAPAAIGDFYFHGWSGADADAFADPNGQITNFTMPDDEVTLKAVYLATGTTSTAISSQAPFAVSSSQVFSPGDAINAFNGVGLGGDDLHDVGFNLGWMANGAVAEGKWITIDLGGEYELTSLDVWNGNLPGATGKGIQQADIYYSANANFDFDLNAHGTDTSFNVGGWNALILDQQFHESVPDAATGKAPQTDHILLDGTKARYLAISVDSNFLPENTSLGSPEDIALSEIKINGAFVPPPAFPLTVNGGIGTNGESFGEYPLEGPVLLAADAPAAGFIFDAWIGDVSGVADVTAATTFLTMTTDSPSVTATYKATTPINFIPNLALGKEVTTSSSFGTDTGDKAVDGIFSVTGGGESYWRHGTDLVSDPTPSLVVDLGREYDNIDRINLGFFLGRIPDRYTLEVSSDEITWTEVANNPDVVQTTRQDNLFDPLKARYVRYTIQEIDVPRVGFAPLDTIEIYQTRPVQEFVRREGIPNFIQKLEAGEDVTVAYMGGSVTQALVQDDPSLGGFRVQSLRELKRLYPASEFTEINSSFGGQGTGPGNQWVDENDFTIDPVTQDGIFAQRQRLAVLNRPVEPALIGPLNNIPNPDYPHRPNGATTDQAKNPDVVFIEFAINDSHKPSETLVADLESIIRKIWSSNNPNDGSSNNTTDIVFLYTQRAVNGLTEVLNPNGSTTVTNYVSTGGDATGENFDIPTDSNDVYTLNQDRYQVSASVFEEVADYYGIPSIHMTKDYARRLGNGEFIHQDLFVDRPDTENDIFTANPAGLPVFSTDGVHPNAKVGHTLYEEALERGFNGLQGNAGTLVRDLNVLVPIRDAVSYDLDVVDGTGTGSYLPGTQFLVNANLPGQTFLAWTGDTSFLADVNAASTLFTMPSAGATLTATYSSTVATSTLTVIGGTGSGVFDEGTTQSIVAPATLNGFSFLAWTGDTTGIVDATMASTSIVIQSTDASITATYEQPAATGEVIPFSQLTLTASSTDTYAGSISSIEQAFNGAGIIANDEHDGVFSNGWISDNGASFAAGEWIKVDLNGVYDLTSLEIWNGNQANVTRRGIQQGDIYVATSDPGGNPGDAFNASAWTPLILDQAFAQSPGGNIASTDTISLVDAAGNNLGVSFLAIHVDSTYASDLNSVSIGEIRLSGIDQSSSTTTSTLTVIDGTGSGVFDEGTTQSIVAPATLNGFSFLAWTGDTTGIVDATMASTSIVIQSTDASITATYEQPAATGEVIPFSQLTLTASSTDTYAGSISSIEQAFNGAGIIANDEHDGIFSNGWISDNGASFAAGEWIKVDLNGVYDLTSLEIWNGNQANVTRRGIQQGDIYVATSDPGGNPGDAFNASAWTPLILDQAFAQSPGGNIASTDTISLVDAAGNNLGVSFLAIHVDSTYASDLNSVSIGEIRLSGIDQSSSTTTSTLTVIGGTGSGVFDEGTTQSIVAPATLNGFSFLAWTGDTTGIVDATMASTSIVIQSTDASITATYEQPAATGEVIPFSQLTLTASSTDTYAGSISSIEQAFNGAGIIANDEHDGVFSNGWISDNGASFAAGEWIKVDLNGVYDLTSLEIWNGNQANVTRRGIQQGDIYVATSDPGGNPGDAFNASAWTPLILDQAFAQSPGGNIASTDTISLVDAAGNNLGVSFLAIHVDSTYASDLNSVSIGEIRLSGIDQSSSTTTSTLTVIDGTGSGVFDIGFEQSIEADTPVLGSEFSHWSGDVAGVVDVNLPSTMFTMQSTDSVVTANYDLINYELTVVGGQIVGAGSSTFMTVGSIVDIVAPDFVNGIPFSGWSAGVGANASQFLDASAASTEFQMNVSDATIIATYSALIPPGQLAAISSSQYSNFDVEDAFDSTGLTGDLHNANTSEGWMSAGTGAAGQWVIVDLGDTYTLDHLRAWNYNDAIWHERGIAQADIYYSTSGVGNNVHNSGTAFDASGWQTLVNDQAFTRAVGEASMENTDASIDLLQEIASHVAIVVDSNFGGNFVGFAEMQFYGSPAIGASSASLAGGDDGSFLTGLTLESQQLSATDEALLLFEEPEEIEESNGSLLSDPYTASDLDDAFQQLGLLGQEEGEEEEEEDFGSLLVSGGLSS